MRKLKLYFSFPLMLGLASPAFADCQQANVAYKQAEKAFGPAMEEYEKLSKAMMSVTDRGALVDKAITVNQNLITAYDIAIDALEQSKAQGCVTGQYANDYLRLLEQLKVRREEFKGEAKLLVNNADKVKHDHTDDGKASIDIAIETLDKNFKAMNEAAPVSVDSKTQLIRVERRGRLLIYNMKLAIDGNVVPKKLFLDKLQHSATKQQCESEVTRALIAYGFEYTYFYQDTNGMVLGTSTVSKQTCEGYFANRVTGR